MRNSHLFTISAICLLTAGLANGQADSCQDSVVINDQMYAVPEMWCGHRVDSTLLADPMTLARLPEEYAFEDYRIYLTRATRDAFVTMALAAAKDSLHLAVRSGYRSSGYQRKIIARRITEGKTFAEVARFVAPPGYSTHETGRAADISAPSEADLSFAESRAYQWLIENASRYGFDETYPKNDPDGRPWEPWHWQLEDSLIAKITTADDGTSAPVPD